MARADILVLPSYDEGLPLVILEAMAQAVAVVCTPVGEIGQVIADGQQALFVTAGDVPALAHQLQQVLTTQDFVKLNRARLALSAGLPKGSINAAIRKLLAEGKLLQNATGALKLL